MISKVELFEVHIFWLEYTGGNPSYPQDGETTLWVSRIELARILGFKTPWTACMTGIFVEDQELVLTQWKTWTTKKKE